LEDHQQATSQTELGLLDRVAMYDEWSGKQKRCDETSGKKNRRERWTDHILDEEKS